MAKRAKKSVAECLEAIKKKDATQTAPEVSLVMVEAPAPSLEEQLARETVPAPMSLQYADQLRAESARLSRENDRLSQEIARLCERLRHGEDRTAAYWRARCEVAETFVRTAAAYRVQQKARPVDWYIGAELITRAEAAVQRLDAQHAAGAE